MSIQEQYCPSCGRIHVKEMLGIYATKEETDSLALINNKLSCAAQAARPDAIPQGVDPERAKLFVQAAIDSIAKSNGYDLVLERNAAPYAASKLDISGQVISQVSKSN